MAENDTSKLVDAIASMPSIRRSFTADPIGALKTIAPTLGIKPDQVDLAALELIASLSEAEVKLVQELRTRIPPNLTKGHDGAIIF